MNSTFLLSLLGTFGIQTPDFNVGKNAFYAGAFSYYSFQPCAQLTNQSSYSGVLRKELKFNLLHSVRKKLLRCYTACFFSHVGPAHMRSDQAMHGRNPSSFRCDNGPYYANQFRYVVPYPPRFYIELIEYLLMVSNESIAIFWDPVVSK